MSSLFVVQGNYDEASPDYIIAESFDRAAELFMEAVINRWADTPIADFKGLDGLNVTQIVATMNGEPIEGLLRPSGPIFIPMEKIEAWSGPLISMKPTCRDFINHAKILPDTLC